jgi:hypothetical protein
LRETSSQIFGDYQHEEGERGEAAAWVGSAADLLVEYSDRDPAAFSPGLIHLGRDYQIFLDFSNDRTAQKRVNASRQPAIAIELR